MFWAVLVSCSNSALGLYALSMFSMRKIQLMCDLTRELLHFIFLQISYIFIVLFLGEIWRILIVWTWNFGISSGLERQTMIFAWSYAAAETITKNFEIKLYIPD
jgi:hypothetical protein